MSRIADVRGRTRARVFALALAAAAVFALPTAAQAAGNRGFDENGFNATARVFVGTGEQWCLYKGYSASCLDYGEEGDWSNDKLVMKWNKAWDDCNDAGNNDEDACIRAKLTNEWNGKHGGSGEIWHYKFIWIGKGGESAPHWRAGGEPIWGTYEVIQSQGISEPGNHEFPAHARPNGFGGS